MNLEKCKSRLGSTEKFSNKILDYEKEQWNLKKMFFLKLEMYQ